MSKSSLLNRLVPPASSAVIEQRLLKAREALAKAEASYRAATLEAVASGQDSSPAEYSAEEALTKAKAAVSRLETALAESQVRERTNASATLKAQQDAEDAKVQAAYDRWAATAKAFGPAAEAYAKAYDALIEAGLTAGSLVAANPRARPDLAHQPIEALASLELTRVAKAHLPPGADRLASVSRDPRTITPIADHVASLAAVILGRG